MGQWFDEIPDEAMANWILEQSERGHLVTEKPADERLSPHSPSLPARTQKCSSWPPLRSQAKVMSMSPQRVDHLSTSRASVHAGIAT